MLLLPASFSLEKETAEAPQAIRRLLLIVVIILPLSMFFPSRLTLLTGVIILPHRLLRRDRLGELWDRAGVKKEQVSLPGDLLCPRSRDFVSSLV
ncbi:unnamed protein product [Linum tenue]|uniref:Uncharacterized protein n=1 Tax=Linum tenue TaxID=586396 RepID=A0AAV0PSL7_9ROSI|nr:unnamed protein product [Linum tenue]